MAFFPRSASLQRSLAALILAASVLLAGPPPAVAADTAKQQLSAAWLDHLEGRSLTARKGLGMLLQSPEGQPPMVRLAALEALLDICIRSHADACLREHAQAYVDTAEVVAGADEARRADLALRAAYYFDQGRLALHNPEVTAKILDWPPWQVAQVPNPRLELQRQVLASNIHLALDDHLAARRQADMLLAMAATLTNPQEDRLTVAWALTDAIGTLIALGESDRAYGLYRAAGPGILRALPPRSLEAAMFRLDEAALLQEQGDLKGSMASLDDHLAIIDAIELEPDVRRWLTSQALTSKAAACAMVLDRDCARAALARHPLANLYAGVGRRPAAYDEVTYLAVRALAAALAGGSDPVAGAALNGPVGFAPSKGVALEVEVYRVLGAALGQPPGQARADGLFEAGRQYLAMVRQAPKGGFGAWRRPGAIERAIIALALTQADSPRREADATAFALLQMAARQSSTFDADAQTVLAQAHSGDQRRMVHTALRLRARRDRLERQELRRVGDRLGAESRGTPLAWDPERHALFVATSDHIAAADRALASERIASSGANLVSLKQFQAALRPDEAALTLTPVPGGMAYGCIRRDQVQRQVLPRDLRQVSVDVRIVQAGLTAGHAPSDQLDAQFPVAAAVRLHDTLIKPFDGCLRPGDQILWLAGIAFTPLPLAVLLPAAPPKAPGGFDLAAADWLMRRHAVSYPGAASLIVAARAMPRPNTRLDFLGVGDPIFDRPVAGGRDLSGLAALPETKDELEQSARGFRAAKLILRAGATETAVRREPLADYRFLSFATHGLIRDELKGLDEPALALTPISAAPEDDGLLTASEIADLNLAARFVALSACNTANFDLNLMSGELSALSSAFAIAGAPSVLGTMWPVDSETGKRVVAATFEALAGDPTTGAAEALLKAQRSFLAAPPSRAHAHPRFWAPFIVLGDGAAAP